MTKPESDYVENYLSFSTCDLVLPGQTNSHGTLFGGAALALMDKAAAIVALRHSNCDVVTAAMESVSFENPIYEAEIVEVVARLVGVGRTSMRVEVDLFGENTKTEARRKCTTGTFIMVAIDSDKNPVEVPPLLSTLPETEKQRILDSIETYSEYREVVQRVYPNETVQVPDRFVKRG